MKNDIGKQKKKKVGRDGRTFSHCTVGRAVGVRNSPSVLSSSSNLTPMTKNLMFSFRWENGSAYGWMCFGTSKKNLKDNIYRERVWMR